MWVLGIDACLGHCSVAVLSGDDVVAGRSEAMARGHVERLAPMVSEVLAQAGIPAESLDLIGVTCGPGGFTGARLGAAFARGLALASGARAVGVTTLEALAFPHAHTPLIVALDGRRGDLFVQAFGAGESAPQAIGVNTLAIYAAHYGTPRILGPSAVPPIKAAHVAQLAMRSDQGESPRPLYLRAADAKAAARPVLR